MRCLVNAISPTKLLQNVISSLSQVVKCEPTASVGEKFVVVFPTTSSHSQNGPLQRKSCSHNRGYCRYWIGMSSVVF